MAVTIHTEPNTYQTSDNPLLYRFSSDQTLQPNFSYIVETFYNGQIVHTGKIFPEVGIYSHWDSSKVISLTALPPVLYNSLAVDNGMLKSTKIKVTENYGTVPINQASGTSTTTYVFKGKTSDDDYVNTTIDSYQGSTWFTNAPNNECTILRGLDSYLSMLVDNGSQTLTMKFYDVSDTLLHTYTVANDFDIWQLNVKSSLLTSTAGVPDISLVTYFTCQIGTSDIFTLIYNDETCYDAHQLTWINEFGVPDQFVFSHNNITKGSAKYESYKKKFGAWSGTDFVYDLGNTGETNYITMVEESGEISSGWLTQEMQNFLVEIYRSPKHLLYNSVGDFIPVRLTDASYEYKQSKYEELFNEVVKYELITGRNSMRL